jgi:putative endonuclease
MPYFVYFMANKHNTVLYLGRTSNLPERIYTHREHLIKGFTSKYNCDKLVYFEIFEDKDAAAQREWQMKKWKRQWKNELIEKLNPNWEDLFPDLMNQIPLVEME